MLVGVMAILFKNGIELNSFETSDAVLLDFLIINKIASQSYVIEWKRHQEFHASEQLCRQTQLSWFS